jgi:hypothetical protein
MQNIAANSLKFQSKYSWIVFSGCTTVAQYVLASRTAHKNQQYDAVSCISFLNARCAVYCLCIRERENNFFSW